MSRGRLGARCCNDLDEVRTRQEVFFEEDMRTWDGAVRFYM